MAKDRKDKAMGPEDFIKYNKGKMRGSERNSFERELQKDPFAEEASEGFKSISADEAEKDIKALKRRLNKRAEHNKFPVYLRIAASVAVLFALSVVVVINSKRKDSINLARAEREDRTIEIKAQAPITSVENTAKTDQKKENVVADETKPVSITAGIKEKKERKAEEIPLVSPPERVEIISESIMREEEKNAGDITNIQYARDKKSIAAPSAAKAGSVASVYSTTTGKVISADDNMPIPGVNIKVKGTTQGTITDLNGDFSINLQDPENNTLVASFIGMKTAEFSAKEKDQKIVLESEHTPLSEVVVIGYGTMKDAKVAAKNPDLGPMKPLPWKPSIDTYNNENLRRSDSLAAKNAEVVVAYYETEEDDSTVAKGPAYKPPEPVSGKPAFDKYIDKNIRRPDTLTGKRVVVVLNILVRQNGNVDSIEVVKSPGKQFSEEAIRIIKEGPSWKPAENEGKSIEDKVRIRIIFN